VNKRTIEIDQKIGERNFLGVKRTCFFKQVYFGKKYFFSEEKIILYDFLFYFIILLFSFQQQMAAIN